jgi:glycosyltransferase involved in cell wall biosynthesis
MKLAIVCDDLIQFGGQERIVEAVLDIWPDAPLYTTVVSKEWRKKLNERGTKYFVSFMQRLPFVENIYRYYAPFIFYSIAFEKFDFTEYDVVLSISSRFAHHIVTKPTTKHICYMNTPGRMLWEDKDYFEQETYGKLKPIKILARPFLSLPLNYLRMIDYAAAQRVDSFIANSKTPKKRIKKYYGRDSTILYPFIDVNKFDGHEQIKGDYFLILTRLASWKKVDIAIEACKRLKVKLKVIGSGPDLERLKRLANEYIEILGYVDDEETINIIKNCKAVIITQFEDFGIVPLEAMACGKPVIAYRKGGALETVEEGKTGSFFDHQTPESLMSVLSEFKEEMYSQENCKRRAINFDRSNFVERIKDLVNKT